MQLRSTNFPRTTGHGVISAFKTAVRQSCAPFIDEPWCISAAAMAVYVFGQLGVRARPVLAAMTGFGHSHFIDANKRSWGATEYCDLLNRSGRPPALAADGTPWPGHVAVVVNDRILVDAAVSQVRAGNIAAPDVLVAPVANMFAGQPVLVRYTHDGRRAGILYDVHRWDPAIELLPEWQGGRMIGPPILDMTRRLLEQR